MCFWFCKSIFNFDLYQKAKTGLMTLQIQILSYNICLYVFLWIYIFTKMYLYMFVVGNFLKNMRFFVFRRVVVKHVSNNTFLAQQISLAIKWSTLVSYMNSTWLRVFLRRRK